MRGNRNQMRGNRNQVAGNRNKKSGNRNNRTGNRLDGRIKTKKRGKRGREQESDGRVHESENLGIRGKQELEDSNSNRKQKTRNWIKGQGTGE